MLAPKCIPQIKWEPMMPSPFDKWDIHLSVPPQWGKLFFRADSRIQQFCLLFVIPAQKQNKSSPSSP